MISITSGIPGQGEDVRDLPTKRRQGRNSPCTGRELLTNNQGKGIESMSNVEARKDCAGGWGEPVWLSRVQRKAVLGLPPFFRCTAAVLRGAGI